MKSIGDRVGRQENAKQVNLQNQIKCKMIDTYFFYIGGYRRVTCRQVT